MPSIGKRNMCSRMKEFHKWKKDALDGEQSHLGGETFEIAH